MFTPVYLVEPLNAQIRGSLIKIGSQMRGGSIDVSSYSGYKNFTVDNFIFKNVNLDMEGGWANLDYMTSSYDTTTGVYTFQLPYHPYTAVDDRHVTGYAKADVYLILNWAVPVYRSKDL